MTTDTEALRAKFETTIAAICGGRPYVLDCRLDNGAYAAKDFQTAWLCYQAGHAAAKAETAAEAKERERATEVLASFIPEWDGQEAVDGGDLIRMLIDAIRAGVKEPDGDPTL